MKKLFSLLIVISLFYVSTKAQDKIYKLDKSVIDCKIVEIPDDLIGIIKYKKLNNLTGPTFTIECEHIYMVHLQSGEDLFPPSKKKIGNQNDDFVSEDYGQEKNNQYSGQNKNETNSGSVIIWAGPELANYGSISIYCDGQFVGSITKFVNNENEVPDCGANGFVTVSRTGVHNFKAIVGNGTTIRSWGSGFSKGCHKTRIRTTQSLFDDINSGKIQRVNR
jgi:hypothetical protein